MYFAKINDSVQDFSFYCYNVFLRAGNPVANSELE